MVPPTSFIGACSGALSLFLPTSAVLPLATMVEGSVELPHAFSSWESAVLHQKPLLASVGPPLSNWQAVALCPETWPDTFPQSLGVQAPLWGSRLQAVFGFLKGLHTWSWSGERSSSMLTPSPQVPAAAVVQAGQGGAYWAGGVPRSPLVQSSQWLQWRWWVRSAYWAGEVPCSSLVQRPQQPQRCWWVRGTG